MFVTSMRESSPTPRPTVVRRIVKLLVLVDLVVLIIAVAVWLAIRGDDERENVVNDGLRGSRPPQGQTWPGLATVSGIDPPMPALSSVVGRPTVLIATCVECRSADVIGGFLSRMRADDLSEDARLVILAWGGDVQAWSKQWKLDEERYELHAAATPGATNSVQRTIGIARVDGAEESGAAFVYDATGRWRSTFFLGQLDRDDIAHDLAALEDER